MSQFDYQSIIEACGIQDENIKKTLDEKNESVTKFQEQLNTFKKLTDDKDKKHENLLKLNFVLDKNVQTMKKVYDKFSKLNKKYKKVQDEISHLKHEFQQKSTDFVEKMTKMDDELKELYSQFEGETLTNLLSDLTAELLSIQDNKAQLENSYEELKKSPNKFGGYERPKILKEIMWDKTNYKDLEEIGKKLANKKRNIQFLVAEYNKKMELLEKFS